MNHEKSDTRSCLDLGLLPGTIYDINIVDIWSGRGDRQSCPRPEYFLTGGYEHGYQLPGKAYTHQVSSRSNVYGRHHTYLLTIHGLIGGVTVRTRGLNWSGLNRRRDRQHETARSMYI